MSLPELPLTPTGETVKMWTIIVVCDGCKTMLNDLPEVEAETEEQAGRVSRRNAQARGWTQVADAVDLCPQCTDHWGGEQL